MCAYVKNLFHCNCLVKYFIAEDGIVDAWECWWWEPGGRDFPEPPSPHTPPTPPLYTHPKNITPESPKIQFVDSDTKASCPLCLSVFWTLVVALMAQLNLFAVSISICCL